MPLRSLVRQLQDAPLSGELLERCGRSHRLLLRGAGRSTRALVASALARRSGRPLLVVVVPHDDDAFEVMIRSAYHLSGGKDGAASTTNMRVLCIFDNGDKKFLTIEDDLGLDKTDHEELLRRVAAQGLQGVVRVDAFGTQ